MRSLFFFLLVFTFVTAVQGSISTDSTAIYAIVAAYNNARMHQDAEEIAKLFTEDADQLVSTGTWRHGREALVKGMLASSRNNPGQRELLVEKIRFLSDNLALADARYTIHQSNGSIRKMWSCFVLQKSNGAWKISAIRNMLPRH
jgi:uncharacterized protein (TIGR02246 family)